MQSWQNSTLTLIGLTGEKSSLYDLTIHTGEHHKKKKL